MSLSCPVRLGEVHSELSCILYAAQQEFKDVGGMLDFRLTYSQFMYLQLEASFWGTAEQKQRIVEILTLRLQRGIIHGAYDFRFNTISYSTHFTEHIEPHYLTASVDLFHWPHRRPHGWDPSRPAYDPSKHNWEPPPATLPPGAGVSPV